MTAQLLTFEYQGAFVSFDAAGWFNATSAAARYGKRPVDWIRLDETQSYLRALAIALKISEPKSLIHAKRNSGTWLHPKLAVRFAQWLDVSFAVWCDFQIDSILRASAAPPDILRLLLADTAAEWELRFPPEYYRALAHITGTTYCGHSQGTPSIFAQITHRRVYAQIMPKDVLAAIKSRKAGSEKIHQWLTGGGAQLLDRQISKITAIAESSVDLADFEARCLQSGMGTGQLRLVWPVGVSS